MADKGVSPRKHRTKGAFTLVEMLVVVGIVGLLAAIVFPAFSRVRASGRRATCASNLRQIGMALNQYAQDNRSFYPSLNNRDGCAPWADAVFPYIKSEQVFQCPELPEGLYKTGCPPDDLSDPPNRILFDGSYSLNLPGGSRTGDRIHGGGLGSAVVPFPSTIRYTRPSSTILALDGDGYFVSPMGAMAGSHMNPPDPPATDVAMLNHYGIFARHADGINVAFADGHVKWMRLESLLKPSLWLTNGPE